MHQTLSETTMKYNQSTTLPDGRPATLTYSVTARRLDPSEAGGHRGQLGAEDVTLATIRVGSVLHIGTTPDCVTDEWLTARLDEAYDALDSDTLKALADDEYGGPDE